ncbi:histone-lysine N-methyltransferase, H3 lysine-9 specific SUVH6-like [Syzygium oleosum]|uniref:histone-lysine N-methyltransferase, H3 lysine-9 specific SUVH6-like n=1 Tax=Syzygium oleosum TaxID=219896 RepID=UPI0024BA8B28|nr:histone-lysine N-methyltransferase, H3 lysine-9 specific SUVH6-like [Syzygium oleosum]
MMENGKDKIETESIEEGEFIPDKSANDSVESSMNAHDVIWRGNEKKCALQGQSPFDGSKSSILMKNMTRDSRPEKNANFTRNDGHDLARERVIATLRFYRDICRELSREKSKAGKENTCIRRIDYHAAKEVQKRRGYVHSAMQFIGDVPGVKVGDNFYYRMELVVVGLHRPPQSGIDYMGRHPNILATSVVASWDYTDNLSTPDELVYLGQGGMPGHHKKAKDQKLTRGNLALVNSMKRNKPVRVIRKDRDHTFTYDGLYMVARYRKLRRANRQMVFEFLMKRIRGQPEIGQKKKKMKVLESS